MGLVLENADEFFGALDVAIAATQREAEQAIDALGNDIAERERVELPRGEGWHAADHIEVDHGRTATTYFVDVGPPKRGFYLAFREFGTHHQPPRPTIRALINAAVVAWRG